MSLEPKLPAHETANRETNSADRLFQTQDASQSMAQGHVSFSVEATLADPRIRFSPSHLNPSSVHCPAFLGILRYFIEIRTPGFGVPDSSGLL